MLKKKKKLINNEYFWNIFMIPMWNILKNKILFFQMLKKKKYLNLE